MSDQDLRPPFDGIRRPPTLSGGGGPKWWEPLASKRGLLALVIVIGLALGTLESIFKIDWRTAPEPQATRPPETSEEDEARQRYERDKAEADKRRPAMDAKQKKYEADRANLDREWRVDKRRSNIAAQELYLNEFRAALDQNDGRRITEVIEKRRADYLALAGLEYTHVLDKNGKTRSHDPKEAHRVSGSLIQADRSTAKEIMVEAFKNPNLHNIDIVVATSYYLRAARDHSK